MSFLPPAVAKYPAVRKMENALDRARSTNKDLREEAANAQSPMLQTLATQGGAVGAAAITAYAPPEHRTLSMIIASGGALAGGIFSGKPWLISVANGIGSILSYEGSLKLFTRKGKKKRKPDPEPTDDDNDDNNDDSEGN